MSGKKDSKHINLAGVSAVSSSAGAAKGRRKKPKMVAKAKSRAVGDITKGRVKKGRSGARSSR